MTENVRICELNWMEYERRLREEAPVVMLPVGSLEQHGPHLPLHCDSLIPTAICEGAAARIGGLVAPTISYGYKSQPKSGGGKYYRQVHRPPTADACRDLGGQELCQQRANGKEDGRPRPFRITALQFDRDVGVDEGVETEPRQVDRKRNDDGSGEESVPRAQGPWHR